MRATIYCCIFLASGLSAAFAQDEANGRYAMAPIEGGLLRLDTRTGETAFCKMQGDTVECRASGHNRPALEAEIERLTRENAELKSRLAGPPPHPRMQEEMNRALEFAEQFMRRMTRIMREEKSQERT
jgi:hypothetical protein